MLDSVAMPARSAWGLAECMTAGGDAGEGEVDPEPPGTQRDARAASV